MSMRRQRINIVWPIQKHVHTIPIWRQYNANIKSCLHRDNKILIENLQRNMSMQRPYSIYSIAYTKACSHSAHTAPTYERYTRMIQYWLHSANTQHIQQYMNSIGDITPIYERYKTHVAHKRHIDDTKPMNSKYAHRQTQHDTTCAI